MSTVVLDRTEQTVRLESFIDGFQDVVQKTNNQAAKQKRINKFLDRILDMQQYVASVNAEYPQKLSDLSEFLWFINPDEQSKVKLKKVADLMHELAGLMRHLYRTINEFFYKNQISRAALVPYLEHMHRMEELANDLDNRFFLLPADDEFMDIMQQLENM